MKKILFFKFFIFLIFLFIINNSLFSSEYIFKDILSKLKERFEELFNYQCTFESFTAKNKKSMLNVFNYYYSKPKLIRMEIIKGEKEGTVLLYNSKDDKIRLRLNKGLFSSFIFTFDPSSKLISDLRGLNISHSDWGWFIDRHLENIDKFNINFIKEENINEKELLFLELISKDPKKTENIVKENIWIDKNENVIVKYQVYDITGELVQASSFSNIILNPDIDKKLFISLVNNRDLELSR